MCDPGTSSADVTHSMDKEDARRHHDESPVTVTALLDGRPPGMNLPPALADAKVPSTNRRRKPSASDMRTSINRRPDLWEARTALTLQKANAGQSAHEVWGQCLAEWSQKHATTLSAASAEFVPSAATKAGSKLNASALAFVPQPKPKAPAGSRPTKATKPVATRIRRNVEEELVVKWNWWRTLRAAEPFLA